MDRMKIFETSVSKKGNHRFSDHLQSREIAHHCTDSVVSAGTKLGVAMEVGLRIPTIYLIRMPLRNIDKSTNQKLSKGVL
jgi:hypothetical protein